MIRKSGFPDIHVADSDTSMVEAISPMNLDKAIEGYRRVAMAKPHPLAFSNLARASMKLGEHGLPAAFKYLDAGREIEQIVETDLGFGEYYRSKPMPDYVLSQQ